MPDPSPHSTLAEARRLLCEYRDAGVVELMRHGDEYADEFANVLEDLVEQLEAARQVLERIANVADRRPDGTYNYDRDALRQMARDALASNPAKTPLERLREEDPEAWAGGVGYPDP